MAGYANIVAIGSAKGSLRLTNEDLVKLLGRIEDAPETGTSDDWIVHNTGIQTRPIVSSAESVYSLTADAARALYRTSGRSPESLDHIIVATSTPPHPFPPVAAHIARELDVTVAANDLVAGCAGFIYGLMHAKALVADGAEEVLLIGAEGLSRMSNYADRSDSILWGDMAGAFLIKRSNSPGLLDVIAGSEPAGLELIRRVKKPGKHLMNSEEGFYLSDEVFEPFIDMAGPEVFKWVTTEPGILGVSVNELLERNELDLKEIAVIIPHQANGRMIRSAVNNYWWKNRAALTAQGMSKEDLAKQWFNKIEHYGNSSAASVPVAFGELLDAGSLKPGDRYIFSAFGTGLLWAAALGVWNPE